MSITSVTKSGIGVSGSNFVLVSCVHFHTDETGPNPVLLQSISYGLNSRWTVLSSPVWQPVSVKDYAEFWRRQRETTLLFPEELMTIHKCLIR